MAFRPIVMFVSSSSMGNLRIASSFRCGPAFLLPPSSCVSRTCLSSTTRSYDGRNGGGSCQGNRGRGGRGGRGGGGRPVERDPTVPPERVAELESRRHDGFIAIDKPEGWGSADVVAKVKATMEKTLRQSLGRRIEVKVGHGGTLDPIATGVLVLGLGAACKDISSFLKGSKSYRAIAMFGAEYDTMDRTGKIIEEMDSSHVTLEALENVLPAFRGQIMQRPPMYSAIKKEGKPVYALAREGKTVDLPERPVEIFSLELEPGHELPEFGFSCSVGGGTYVRSLISDMARKLDTRAYMTSLVRTQQGPFSLEDSLDPSFFGDYETLYRHMLKCNKKLKEFLLAKGTQW